MPIEQEINLPIITYHSIDDSGSVISTSPKVFDRQMKHLNESGYSAISLKRLIEKLDAGDYESLDGSVVLTFDDGFRNFYTTAFPVLREYGFEATVFLVTDRCGEYNDWEDNPPELPRSELLDWPQVIELAGKGVEFGVHTRTHPDLTKLEKDGISAEIIGAKKKTEEMLQTEIVSFAYPYGKYDSNAKTIVEKHFKAACSTKLGKVDKNSDLYSLERIDSYYLQKDRVFNALSTSKFDRYMQIRNLMRVCKSLIYQN